MVKRNGEKEEFNPKKINQILEWATEGISGTAPSDIAMNANIQLFDGIYSSSIHDLLISSASGLITEENPNYSKVASRLLNYKIRKHVWGGKNPPKLYSLVKKNVERGNYTERLLEWYSESEFNKVDEFIDHSRDNHFEHAGIQQLVDKYLVQDRSTKEILETPQFALALIAMVLHAGETKDRIKHVKRCYTDFSKHKINVSTPIMAGARTPTESYSSCCLLECADDKRSLFATNTATGLATCDKYGIGLDLSNVRAIGAPIRNGETLHTGVVPWLKMFQSTIHSCQQGGARRGAGTVTFPIFHYEIEDILQLKDNTRTEDTKVGHLDYSITLSKLFWDRLIKKGNITLFSSHEAKEVYDAFGTEEFDEIYECYEKKKLKFKKTVKAEDLFDTLVTQRIETGRIYPMNIDQCNQYGSWVERVKFSNLCVAGDQRVVSDRGLLTARELYEQGGELTLFDGEKPVKSSPMQLIEKNAEVWRIELENGMFHDITPYHMVLTSEKDKHGVEFAKIKRCDELSIGDRVSIQRKKGVFGKTDMTKEAFLLGLYQSDGTQHKDVVMLDLWENDFDLLEEVHDSFSSIHYKYGCNIVKCFNGFRDILPANFHDCQTGPSQVKKKRLASKTLKKALNFEKGYVPSWVWESSEETVWQYVRGLLYADGSAFVASSNGNPLQINYIDINKDFLKELQLLFANLGLQTSIRKCYDEGFRPLPDGKGSNKEYFCKSSWRLIVGNKNDALEIEKHTGFLSRKGQFIEDRTYRDNTKKHYKIKSITRVEDQDVFCVTVDSEEHLWVCNGVITHNCQEILHDTKPFYGLNDPEGEIGVCVLSSVNMLKVDSDRDHEKVCQTIVRMLDNLIDIQEYFDASAERFATKKRSIGVGVTNVAGWLASKGLNHCSTEAPDLINEFMEKQQYYLLKASCELAKERGPCEKFHLSKYSQGFMPLDMYNKTVDELLTVSFFKNGEWDSLKEGIAQYGLRHCTLSCQAPHEASSIIQGSTNGMEPIRSLITYKTSKTGDLKVLAPSLQKWKNKYITAFEMPSNEGLINVGAAISKWLDMSASFNLYSPSGEVSIRDVIIDLLTATKYGIKTFYYHNTDDGDKQEMESSCESGACSL